MAKGRAQVVWPTPTDSLERPTVNPSVPPGRLAFVNELEEDLTADFPAQTWETLRHVNAGKYLTFNEGPAFAKPERRPQSP